MMIKRVWLAGATAFLSINLFTGAPLLALWMGSQASGDTILSMKAVAVVIVVFAVLVVGSAFALTWLNNTYDELIGRQVGERRAPWMRDASSRGFMSSRVGETLLERIVILSVYVATISLLIWFFFFAHASL
jgi:hypothetical protein